MAESKLYRYMEIKGYDDPTRIRQRRDLTTYSEQDAVKVELGKNINLNHEKYYTFMYESETELPIIEPNYP